MIGKAIRRAGRCSSSRAGRHHCCHGALRGRKEEELDVGRAFRHQRPPSRSCVTSLPPLPFFVSSLQRFSSFDLFVLLFFSALVDVAVQLSGGETSRSVYILLSPSDDLEGAVSGILGGSNLLPVTWRRVIGGQKEPVNELANHFEGWSVGGLQTPAERHQLVPERTGVL